jgi:hypothetical protein
VRSTTSTGALVDGGVRKLMANDFLQERQGPVEEKIGNSDLSTPREVEAKGDTHPRACFESDS